MQIELRCPGCPCHFRAAGDCPADEVINRMIDEGPWFALARGETFGAMVFAALAARGRICCPDCGRAVSVTQGSEGRHVSERPHCL